MGSTQPGNLSAREQMHVARATGTPLLDTSANARKKQQIDEKASAGLVGHIGAREREKAAMKTGHRSSMVVENAIRARQDQQAEAQMQAYQQQMQEMQQQNMYYNQQQAYAAPVTPGTQYGYAASMQTQQPQQQQQYQQQQMWQQQQQQQGARTPGNRQSWFGGSYFGQVPQ
jgi:CCR4-NOT transcriptional complex subunit CAF120